MGKIYFKGSATLHLIEEIQTARELRIFRHGEGFFQFYFCSSFAIAIFVGLLISTLLRSELISPDGYWVLIGVGIFSGIAAAKFFWQRSDWRSLLKETKDIWPLPPDYQRYLLYLREALETIDSFNKCVDLFHNLGKEQRHNLSEYDQILRHTLENLEAIKDKYVQLARLKGTEASVPYVIELDGQEKMIKKLKKALRQIIKTGKSRDPLF